MTLRQRLYPIVLGALILLLGYWLLHLENPGQIFSGKPQTDNKSPDFFARNARIVEFDTDGVLDSTLVAEEISHFPHNQITLLDRPDLWTYSEDDQPWNTTSDTGRILPDGETVELIDNVVMIQMDGQGKPEQRVDTEFMTVYSGQDLAETDLPIRLVNKTSVVNAVGMKAFYKQDFIQLKSRVRSLHETR